MPKRLVLYDHDGGVDDLLSTTLLLTMDHVQPLAIVVTPADCYINPAVSATRKILDLMGRSDVPVAESTVRGVNPFPRIFRRDSFTVDLFPILNEKETMQTQLVAETGQNYMASVLREASEPVTLLVTGPLTTVATALEIAPEVELKVREIVWMGGALNVRGNVDPIMENGHDGSAEWNVYWDPFAAYKVWLTRIPITICPLDATNTVPVTPEFVRRLGHQRRYPLSDFAGLCYSLVAHQDYYSWDVLTTAYLAHPEFYQLREVETAIVTAGPSQGRMKIQEGGRRIRAMERVDTDRFHSYILQQWSR